MMDLRSTSRAQRLLLIVLFIAAAMRIGFLYKNWDNLDFAPSFMLHAEVARNILNGHWFQQNQPYLQHYVDSCRQTQRLIDPVDYPPPIVEQLTPLYNDEGGYGFLLAAIWKVTGITRWWPIRALQIIIDLLMCWMVYRIGRKLFGENVGLLSALLYACFVPGIELAVRPHRDIWVTFLFITSVYHLVSLPGSRHALLRLAAIGVGTGIVAWMRSTVLLFVILMIPLLLVSYQRKQAIRYALIIVAGFVLAFSPLIVRNYLVFDKFMATRGAFWHSFWAGIGQTPNPLNVLDDDETIVRFAQSVDSTVQPDTDRYEQLLKTEAMKLIREHPWWYAGSVIKRAAVFVFPRIGREVFFQQQLPQHVTGTLNRSINGIILIGLDVLLGSLFLTGIWIYRKRWKDELLLCYPYLYTLATLAPFYLAGRNIMNVYFVVLIFAAAALLHVRNRMAKSPLRAD